MSESEQAAEIAQLRRQLDAVSERLAEARRAVGLLNAIFDALPVGVTVQTDEGAVVLQNGMAAEISEPSADDASSRAAPFGVGEAEKMPQPAGAITTEERVVAGFDFRGPAHAFDRAPAGSHPRPAASGVDRP